MIFNLQMHTQRFRLGILQIKIKLLTTGKAAFSLALAACLLPFCVSFGFGDRCIVVLAAMVAAATRTAPTDERSERGQWAW